MPESSGEMKVPMKVPENFTFNTPISILVDKFKRVWVTDTGNSQILIFDYQLEHLKYVLKDRKKRVGKSNSAKLILPFHMCDHPHEYRMYVTDPGSGCVDIFRYGECEKDGTGKEIAPVHEKSFGFDAAGPDEGSEEACWSARFLPLMVPNGITIVSEEQDNFIWVTDEFYHDAITEKDEEGGSQRCVKFTDDGRFVRQFRKVLCRGKQEPRVLQWPQGMSSDKNGYVYLANTGRYEILKFKSNSTIDKDGVLHSDQEASVFRSLGDPSGLGKLDVMRGVSVAGDHVFVPDQAINSISIYPLEKTERALLRFTSPHWNSLSLELGSISDFLFSFFRNWILLDPYQVCKGTEEDDYFITEPWISRICKVRIKMDEKKGSAKAELIQGLGARRDKFWQKARVSQFNAVAAVIGMKKEGGQKPEALSPPLPLHMKYNPVQRAFGLLSKAVTWQYKSLYNLLFKGFAAHLDKKVDGRVYLTDAGNWTIKSFSDQAEEVPNTMWGMEVSGNLCLAAYHPPEPLLGQLCPGTPILFVSNFLWSTILMYQFNPFGQLVLYGLPFGIPGKFDSGFMLGAFGVGGLRGPAGLAVNPEGEIFIADSMNGRISKWQLLQTGQAVFRKTFSYYQFRKTAVHFTPVDVAIDRANRVFVADQYNSAIRLFDSEGTPLWTYGRAGHCDRPKKDDPRSFMMPTSIAIDNDYLIVSDPVNRVLKVFKIDTNKVEDCLEYITGRRIFYKLPEKGGTWCPFFIYAADGNILVPDSTTNIINQYKLNIKT